MSFLYLLEKIRVSGLNELMLAVTTLGEETAFLVLALIVFWCVDKRQGYYIMSVGFLGTMANQFLKLLCRVPRPWVLDPEFTILEQAREAAAGYSFPSGHSQTAVGTFGCIAASANKRWIKIVCIVIMVLVPFSRMYVGVHTPADVLVGSGMALLLVWLLRPVVFHDDDKRMRALIAVMLGLSIAFMLFVELHAFPVDMDVHNLESGHKNAYTLLGCLIGVAIVYAADKKWLNFPVKATWWAQLLKIVIGLALVLLVKSGLKAPLEALFGGHMAARAVRYFLVVVTAGVLWPMSFRWFAKLGNNKKGKPE